MKRETICRYNLNAHGLDLARQCIRRNAVNHGCSTAVYVGDEHIIAAAVQSHVDAPLSRADYPLVGVFDESIPMRVLREIVLA